MSTSALVSVGQYLSTSYRPDCDYVDGSVIERNVGEWSHSRLQIALASFLFARERDLGIRVATEQRVQITTTRYRIPDVCAILATAARSPIVHYPPFLCIEILSPEDRLNAMHERVQDYLQLGVSWVWIVDPQSQKAYRSTRSGLSELPDGRLITAEPVLEINLAEFWPLIND